MSDSIWKAAYDAVLEKASTFDESEHPRNPKGSGRNAGKFAKKPGGGQFAPKATTESGDAVADTIRELKQNPQVWNNFDSKKIAAALVAAAGNINHAKWDEDTLFVSWNAGTPPDTRELFGYRINADEADPSPAMGKNVWRYWWD